MPLNTILVLVAVFVSIALLAGATASLVVSKTAPGRRRLETLVTAKSSSGLLREAPQLADPTDSKWDAIIRALPPPFGASAQLKRNLAFAGLDGSQGLALFLLGQLGCAVALGIAGMVLGSDAQRWIYAGLGAVVGFLVPGLLLSRRIRKRQTEVQNGLADALDLLVLCLEAGSSLDQALMKATEELQVSYPVLAHQLQIVISEMRAGKPRLEAFRGFAKRTKVDDARALVAMLVQTDRFGTSIAQALRGHATDCRTRRRQRAEERAEKVGVKLVFPLVFCLFPALFVVILGPAAIQFFQVFGNVQP